MGKAKACSEVLGLFTVIQVRRWVLGVALSAAMSGGCSGAASRGEEEGAPIRRLTEAEMAADEQTRRDAAARYERALSTAPVYRSEIRDELIANPDKYQAGYRPYFDDFRGLESTFRCIHPPEAIARAEADGWQLVKCDRQSAMLYRCHAEPRVCRGRQAIPDQFEILQLWFETPRLAAYEDLDRGQTHLLYAIMPGVHDEVPVQEFNDLVASAPLDDLIVWRSSTNETYEYYILNLKKRQVTSFHKKKNTGSCLQNARGWLVRGRQVVNLDSPLDNYSEMSEALETAALYFGGS